MTVLLNPIYSNSTELRLIPLCCIANEGGAFACAVHCESSHHWVFHWQWNTIHIYALCTSSKWSEHDIHIRQPSAIQSNLISWSAVQFSDILVRMDSAKW